MSDGAGDECRLHARPHLGRGFASPRCLTYLVNPTGGTREQQYPVKRPYVFDSASCSASTESAPSHGPEPRWSMGPATCAQDERLSPDLVRCTV